MNIKWLSLKSVIHDLNALNILVPDPMADDGNLGIDMYVKVCNFFEKHLKCNLYQRGKDNHKFHRLYRFLC